MISDSTELKNFIVAVLEEKKADSVKSMKLTDAIPLCDYMVFASGRSSKNVTSIAESLAYELKHKAERKFSLEGKGSEWVLLDIGDVIVHILHPATREYYKIDEHWQKIAEPMLQQK